MRSILEVGSEQLLEYKNIIEKVGEVYKNAL